MTDVRFHAPDQPGWSAISAGGVFALVRGTDSDDVVVRAREAAGSGELDELLDALTRDGVRTTPDFVAVQDGDPVRVVARGTAYAVVPGPDGDVEIHAARRGPWADEDAPDGTTELVLHSGEPLPAPAAEVLPDGELGSPGAVKGWQLPARLRRGGPPPADAAAAAADADGLAVQDVPGYDYLFGAPGSTGAPPFLPNHDTGTLQEPPIGRVPMEEAAGVERAADPAVAKADETAADLPGGRPSDHTLPPPQHTQQGRPTGTAPATPPGPASPAGPAGAPAAPAPASPGAGSGLIESVPWRRGGSNVAPAEDVGRPATPTTQLPVTPPAPAPAPVEPPPAAAPVSPPAAVQGWGAPAASPATEMPGRRATPSGGPAAPSAPAPTTPSPVPASAPPAPQPLSVPRSEPQPATPEPEPAPAPEVESATVDRASLPVTATGSIPRGPIVLAVLCPAGHPSPPHAGTCRVCDRDIPPQQPFQTPRPPLGTIRLSTGDVVTLDRGVLLGRAPKVNADLPPAQRPHLVRVVSRENDISRNHVEIVLEGWHVLVRDLGSTNGTTVTLPGQQAVRLRPSDSQVIEPGTVVGLADEATFTYEVPS
ncbi:FHA domain-containing protein [Phycicoccus sp. Soil748]|uniref:FHA domain-containing protein n=1 Tax=Phycicoccus sp. Soil748 TaxID=1736397 RepID=UPI0007038FBF|nr:FHA domain-containing protein [Phycicoccus sp. Soil748]KRE56064.1 hypothetical protein ASG70_02465 [Phycicoccus sp. Soil748]